MEFLNECEDKGLFLNNPILVMDNVRFHHCDELKNYLTRCGSAIAISAFYALKT